MKYLLRNYWLLAVMLVVSLGGFQLAVAQDAAITANPTSAKTLTIVVSSPENTPYYDWSLLVFTEAFKRAGATYVQKVFPSARATLEVAQGRVDGEASRIYEFTDNGDNPNHLRVEAVVMNWEWLVYTAKPDIKINGWASLKGKNYKVAYVRGTKKVSDNLAGLIDPANVTELIDNINGFRMLLLGRFDLFISSGELNCKQLLIGDEFRGKGIYKAGVVDSAPLYLYLNKKHAAIAPKIAKALNDMRAEGLMEAYTQKIEQKYGLQ